MLDYVVKWTKPTDSAHNEQFSLTKLQEIWLDCKMHWTYSGILLILAPIFLSPSSKMAASMTAPPNS